MRYTKKEKEALRYRKFQLKITDKMVAQRMKCSREWVTRVKNGVDNERVFEVLEKMIHEIENNNLKQK